MHSWFKLVFSPNGMMRGWMSLSTYNRLLMPIKYSTPVYRMHVAFQWSHLRHSISFENASAYRPPHVQCAQSCCCGQDPFVVVFSPKTCVVPPKTLRHWTPDQVVDWTFVCDRRIHLVLHWTHRLCRILWLPCDPIQSPHDCCPHAIQRPRRTHNRNDAKPNGRIVALWAFVPMWAMHRPLETIADLDSFERNFLVRKVVETKISNGSCCVQHHIASRRPFEMEHKNWIFHFVCRSTNATCNIPVYTNEIFI